MIAAWDPFWVQAAPRMGATGLDWDWQRLADLTEASQTLPVPLRPQPMARPLQDLLWQAQGRSQASRGVAEPWGAVPEVPPQK